MNNWQEFIQSIGPNRISENEQAKMYLEVSRTDDLIHVVKQARRHNIPLYIIGAGSWVKDQKKQIDGLLIKNNCRKFDRFAMSGKMQGGQIDLSHTLVYAESGVIVNQLVRFAIEEGLGGLEYQLGLPGTAGGAIYTNARYTPKSIYLNDFVSKITILDKDGIIQHIQPEQFIQQTNSEFLPADFIILSAIFRLTPENKTTLWTRANEAAEHRAKLLEKI